MPNLPFTPTQQQRVQAVVDDLNATLPPPDPLFTIRSWCYAVIKDAVISYTVTTKAEAAARAEKAALVADLRGEG